MVFNPRELMYFEQSPIQQTLTPSDFVAVVITNHGPQTTHEATLPHLDINHLS